MNIEELYSKYVGERCAWVKYREANVTDIPFTEREIHNYRKDGIDMPDGHTYPGLPKPKNFEEAWEQFVKDDAQMVFEERAEDFLKKYRGVTVGVLEGELSDINEFIARAKATVKTSTAFADRNSFYGPKPNYNSYEEEYIRLSNGYYDSRYDELKQRHCAHTVYGKYFMFKDWLEEQLQNLQGEIKQIQKPQPTNTAQPPKDRAEAKPSLRQIALICVYTNRVITDNNKNDIAKEYGWKCGDKLIRGYRMYRDYTDRIASGKPDENKAKKYDFKRAITYLKSSMH